MSARRKSTVGLQSSASGSKNTKTHMNFNIKNETLRENSKGTKPTAEATSIKETLIMMILHLCKKTLFYDIRLKVALYLLSLFLVSLIADFITFPKSYFSRSDNLFNVYFVKLGWFWTLILAVPFLWFTSFVTNCGDRNKIFWNHLPRIAIATFFWFLWTKLFNVVENNYGRCHIKAYETKRGCLKAGHFWHSFDISGHTFILIYSSLVLIEEAKPIVGWDNIKDYLRLEDHNRKTQEASPSSNPLRALNDSEISVLKSLYEKYTPIIRLLFVGITVLQLLWDIMLVCTMIYYHRMAEKIVSGIIAICTWYFTYRAWYPSKSILPLSAGKGLFNYQQKIATITTGLGRRASLLNAKLPKPSSSATKSSEVPKFMGMPIYKSAAQRNELNSDNLIPSQGKYDFQQPPPKFL